MPPKGQLLHAPNSSDLKASRNKDWMKSVIDASRRAASFVKAVLAARSATQRPSATRSAPSLPPKITGANVIATAAAATDTAKGRIRFGYNGIASDVLRDESPEVMGNDLDAEAPNFAPDSEQAPALADAVGERRRSRNRFGAPETTDDSLLVDAMPGHGPDDSLGRSLDLGRMSLV